MCGRYTLRSSRRFKAHRLRNSDLSFEARYNIAPGQQVMVVADFGTGPELTYMTWGLIPSWSADSKGFINARSETLEDKPSFSESFQRRRCLIPSDGFFEWRRAGRAKQPFYFQLQGDEEFAFAGIWDRWGKGTSAITTCAIITTKANAAVAELHDRMPVILTPESYGDWLDPRASHSALKQLLVPFPASRMSWHPVSSAVNRTENDSPDLVTRVDTEIGTTPSLF
ncbi:MAG TPA: SOS response-associated peptidase [Pyrinomonadaceae bacterium]